MKKETGASSGFSSDFSSGYKGFELVSVNEIPDCDSRAFYLRHKKTGLEIFHLLNEDKENLFAFSFRTPVKNSTGAAHITEHSVFCGSEKFPLKEPFANMMNQSVSTFLNAMTYPDKTVYPASSTLKSDYFNLMDVYADAVFFPLLKKEAFLQEAHRIELNEKGGYEIQGVVYNEMKGSYSSFDSVASDIQLRCLFPGTNYSFDSGGDPLEIPSFTYEAFKEFHRKYYSPGNCLLFLYGNIPTKEQIDFLDEKLISRLEKKYSSENSAFSLRKVPHVPEEFIKMETPEQFENPVHLRKTAPASGAKGSLVTVNWRCGESRDLHSFLECAFLAEVLAGNDGSPLSKALLDSGLGDDLAHLSGVSNETRNFTLSFGLRGVNPKNERKVYSLIFSVLEKIRKDGIRRNDIDAAVMSAEFANREIVRAGEPFSLVLLERTLSCWNYGEEPHKSLLYRSAFEKIRAEAEGNPRYIQNLLEKYIFENSQRVCLSVEPSASYFSEREKSEKDMIRSLTENADKEKIRAELDLLHSYQNHHESEEEVKCIPHLDKKDLNTEAEKSEILLSFLKTKNESEVSAEKSDGAKLENAADAENSAEEKSGIPFFRNIQNTNGIAYLEIGFPCDRIKPEDYKYLPLFSYFATNAGWNGKDWAECSMEAGVKTGGIGARILSQEMPKTEKSKALFEKYRKFNFCGRDWIFFTVKLLAEKAEEGIRLFEECLSSFDFSDLRRMKNLLSEVKSAMKSSVVPHGNRYAQIRVLSGKTHSGTVDEILKGFTQVFFVESLSARKIKSLSRKFSSIKKILFDSGSVVHLTSDKETAEKIGKLVSSLPENLNLKALCDFKGFDDALFRKQTLLRGQKFSFEQKDLKESEKVNEVFIASSQVGFTASSVDSAYFGTKENAAELLLSHWLSSNLLWERIRTSGGAYGAYASSANLSGQFVFSTFRDPNPFKSLKTCVGCLESSSEIQISGEECDRSVTGTYGDEVQPLSPSVQGRVHFSRMLYCISDDDRTEKLKNIVSLSAKDMKSCAARLFRNAENARTCVVCPSSCINKTLFKKLKKSGKIVKLHL